VRVLESQKRVVSATDHCRARQKHKIRFIVPTAKCLFVTILVFKLFIHSSEN